MRPPSCGRSAEAAGARGEAPASRSAGREPRDMAREGREGEGDAWMVSEGSIASSTNRKSSKLPRCRALGAIGGQVASARRLRALDHHAFEIGSRMPIDFLSGFETLHIHDYHWIYITQGMTCPRYASRRCWPPGRMHTFHRGQSLDCHMNNLQHEHAPYGNCVSIDKLATEAYNPPRPQF